MDSEWNAKLSDFGLTKIKLETASMTGVAGTFNWMAPELVEEGKINEKIDIYSFGMILYEMATNLIPFKNLTHVQIITQLLKGNRPFLPDDYDIRMKELVNKCWNQNASSRPSSNQVLAQLELILLDPQSQSIREEYISSEWDFTLDFQNDSRWESKQNYEGLKTFNIHSKLLSPSFSLYSPSSSPFNLEYSLNNGIEYCEWKKVSNLFEREYYSLNPSNPKLEMNEIYAIQNEILNKKFKSNLIKLHNEAENNSESFGMNTWKGDNEKWRNWIFDQFKSLSEQFPNQNGLNNELKVIPLFYFVKKGESIWNICSSGFLPSNSNNQSSSSYLLENGWMGKAIYFSSNLEYLLNVNEKDKNNEEELECDSNGEYSVLLCNVLIYNVYPCIEDPTSNKSLKGKSSKVNNFIFLFFQKIKKRNNFEFFYFF